MVSDVPASVAGVFTTNRVKAAPVLVDRKRVRSGVSRGVIVNSGCANVSVGRRGLVDAEKMTASVESGLSLGKGEALVCSTGLIGGPLPIEKIEAAVPRLIKGLSPTGWHDAARAIMTTDSFPKLHRVKGRVGGKSVTLLGVAKGAGMICPEMATMLAFFMTDAAVPSKLLSKALLSSTEQSFNRISVDNGMSTNDTALIFANGMSGGRPVKSGTGDFKTFSKMLDEVSLELAHMMVRDGEGATKFIELDVRGAATAGEARTAARALAGSLLVKTAFFGSDPNWGRIMAALGSAGVRMREDKVDISFNGVRVARRGRGDAGNERKAARAIRKRDIVVTVNLNMGKGAYKLWTTDLSSDYVKLNSVYRS